MSDTEVLYTANEVYNRLKVSGSTLRKYTDVLQREGYDIKKNSRGRREYTEYDIMLIEKLVELSKHDGMTLEKAAKMIVKQLGHVSKPEEAQETDLIPYSLQQMFQEHYSAMCEQINKVQQANLLEMEKRLDDRIDQRNKLIEADMKDRKEREERIEKRLEQRDENLMKMIREIQEVKRIVITSQEEVAVAGLKRKSWWKLWK
ncbi:DUF3967 domain-containing protein [Bacillus clarus]|uniref:DUF3967 domain-containing protein n=1 Tax=Bacillus clarus TaxID=2338372 RepID=A0A090YA17_9BACI|nr:DUF3967 domain-containing protein [Bacillus clarus]KFM95583.1 merR HTH regulatory family protein [Bacillus clarus]RFT64340.1 DUF3967 domain-containing protein [Bacillus clarus]